MKFNCYVPEDSAVSRDRLGLEQVLCLSLNTILKHHRILLERHGNPVPISLS